MSSQRGRGAACAFVMALVTTLTTSMAVAQERRLEQDPSLNNLVHAPGYETGELGELGRVTKVGQGPRAMILIAGAGFGGEIWNRFMESRATTYTMYAVTLPGFGGTPAPPMPPEGTSYGEQTWTNGAVTGVERLIADEGIERPVIVGHWYNATQVALRVALRNPEEVAAVVVISGVASYAPPAGGQARAAASLEEQIQRIDDGLAPRWFKTVTRETWDDNNFYPSDYAQHPVRALQLWRMAAEPPMPVWIRYLCEAWAQDIKLELDSLEVPTLILQPGFDPEFWFEPGQDYMRAYTQRSWEGVEEISDRIEVETIRGTRVFIMDDRPAALEDALDRFLTPIVAERAARSP